MDVVVVGEATYLDGAQLGEKRPFENVGNDEEAGSRLSKKVKSEAELNRDLKRVATIVLALSTMATMRAGKKPSEAEVVLMTEARAKLAGICEDYAPKDIVGKDGILAAIEDLGFNGKDKDQRLGFRGPRLTIVEKLSQAKRKMEESKKFVAPSATYTYHSLPTSFSVTAENRGISPTLRTFPADRPNHGQISSGGVPASMPSGLVSATISTSSQLHISSNEGKSSIVPRGFTLNYQGRNPPSMLPRPDRAASGTYSSHVEAATLGQPLNVPAWSAQMQSMASAKTGSEQKLTNNIYSSARGASDASMSSLGPQANRDQSIRPLVTRSVPGNLPGFHNPLQGVNFVQPPSLPNSHNEIAKIVQKTLQPRLPDHPTWTPPSRDYMNKTITCHNCQIPLTDVDSVLVCDACEKGYHLKCVQSPGQREIPRGEWHCPRCLGLSNGKPLPPKYGRVMRSNPPPKVSSNSAGVLSSLVKNAGIIDPTINQQELGSDGGPDLQTSRDSRVDGDAVETVSVSTSPNARETTDGKNFSNPKDLDEQLNSVTTPNTLTEPSETDCGFPSVAFSSETSAQHEKNSESFNNEEMLYGLDCESPNYEQRVSSKLPDVVDDKCDELQSADVPQNFDKTTQSHCPEMSSNCTVNDPEKVNINGSSENTSIHAIKQDHDEIFLSSSSDGLHGVDWIGSVEIVGEKAFYQSCSIDGITYRLGDHALFQSSHGTLAPSKLQSMWEDSKTGSKCVNVTRCYFPDNLPGNVAHPCLSESNEVYESNRNSIVMAGLIRGPCQVLPPSKFKEESEKRDQLGFESNNEIHPIFLCKWLYDELKGQFQYVSS